MFGLNDDNQKSNDDPAMLDNVKDLASQPASAVEPPTPVAVTPDPSSTASDPVATPAEPATSADDATQPATEPPVGFNMPSDTPSVADSAVSQQPATPETAATRQSTDENPGHIELPEGFTSNPMTDSGSQQATGNASADLPADDTTLSDNTIPEPATTEVSPPSETPQISQHTTPITKVSSEPAREPEQNDVTSPPAPVISETDASEANGQPNDPKAVDHEGLAAIKKEALGHLEGLSDHIDGSPEEVFKSTMQLIQANDNHTLLQKALDAAKKIEDDKVRAQAMLDIVNETNYFSQNNSDS